MWIKKKFPYRAAYVACKGCNSGEEKTCKYGCVGCGKCVSVCIFGAISIGESGIAEVDEEKCIACGRCAKECPQQVIHIHNCANYIVVRCSNKDKGKEAREACPVSCIGCGMCAVKCPRQAISDLRGVLT